VHLSQHARALEEVHLIKLTRQAVYNVLLRRGVWAPPGGEEKVITLFEKPLPNTLWQVDLMAMEEICFKVYARELTRVWFHGIM